MKTSSVLAPYTLGPMPQFPRQPQLLIREVVSVSVAHTSSNISHLAAVLASDRSSLSVSCEPAFLQALLVQTDIAPGSLRESGVACFAKTASTSNTIRRAIVIR